MNDEKRERPEDMSEEAKIRDRWRNRLKHTDIAKMEDAIADTITKLVNDPQVFYTCHIYKIDYDAMIGGADLSLKLSWKVRETKD